MNYKLNIDWATYEAAKYACINWHYSKCVPVGKLIKIGAWENGKFIGVVIFSRGAAPHIGMPYNLTQIECCELTRVALKNHKCFVSEILAKAIKFLKYKCPTMKLIISYADIEQNHYGGIYQATNWIYEGKTKSARYFIIKGKKVHLKSLHSKYKNKYIDFEQTINWVHKYLDKKATVYYDKGKHKYLFPLDKKTRKQVMKLNKKYPKNI